MSNSRYNTSPPPFAPSYRRASYATIAAGSAARETNSNAHSRQPSASATAIPPPPREAPFQSLRGINSSTGNMSRAYDGDTQTRRPTSAGTGSAWGLGAVRYDGLGCIQHEDHPLFFMPSYLRCSRHVQKLRQEYEAHVSELRERHDRSPSMHRSQPSLSTSPSMTSLNKMNAHRGVAQEIVERFPPSSYETPRSDPLPSRWNEDDKYSGLEILADGTELRFSGTSVRSNDEAAAVRADFPMPKEAGVFYYEVTVLSKGKYGMIGIGFSSLKANLNRLPGWEPESYAYHGDDGFVFASSSSGKAYGPHFSSQDVIGCGLNFRKGTAFFTKNGQYLGTAFSNIKPDRLYPSVGIKNPGEHLRINFGKTPFVFDIDGMVEAERKTVQNEIGKTSVAELHPPDNESALIHKLIGQYLAHEGYIDTAKAFTLDVQERQQSLTDQSQPYQISNEDDNNASQRQRIRRSILDGDIDRALKYTSTYYPNLFEHDRNRDIYFRLRCRKFVEMMRRHAELVNIASSPVTVTKSIVSIGSNGRAAENADDTEEEEPPDTQMELDDQLHRETSNSLEPGTNNDDVDMDASQELPSKRPHMKADELLTAAVAYGQELQQEWKSDPREHIRKQLHEIFAVVAYQNVNASPISHLFEVQGRVQIAEEVNGAILVSLGRPPSAALEKLCAHTEALLDETATRATGSAAALVNVQTDYLQE